MICCTLQSLMLNFSCMTDIHTWTHADAHAVDVGFACPLPREAGDAATEREKDLTSH